MKAYYTISDLAKEFGVTTRTIRHYEEEGLLAPRREGATRLFNSRDRARLKLTLRGKRLGFSLYEICELFKLYEGVGDSKKDRVEDFLIKIGHHRERLERQREDITVMLDEIAFFETQCRKQPITPENKVKAR